MRCVKKIKLSRFLSIEKNYCRYSCTKRVFMGKKRVRKYQPEKFLVSPILFWILLICHQKAFEIRFWSSKIYPNKQQIIWNHSNKYNKLFSNIFNVFFFNSREKIAWIEFFWTASSSKLLGIIFYITSTHLAPNEWKNWVGRSTQLGGQMSQIDMEYYFNQLEWWKWLVRKFSWSHSL